MSNKTCTCKEAAKATGCACCGACTCAKENCAGCVCGTEACTCSDSCPCTCRPGSCC